MISKDEFTSESPYVNVLSTLGRIIPYDLLMQALIEAEILASNDILINASIMSANSKCLISKLILHIRYDFINEIIRRITLEIWISSEITVKDMFDKIGNMIKEFNGSFELTKDYVKVYFNVQSSRLNDVIRIVNVFKELLCANSNLVIDGYKVLIDY